MGRGSAGLSAEDRRNIEAGEERLRAALRAELQRAYASAETTEEVLEAQIEIQNRLLAGLEVDEVTQQHALERVERNRKFVDDPNQKLRRAGQGLSGAADDDEEASAG